MVILDLIASGSIFRVSFIISAKIGTKLLYKIAFDVAIKVKGVVITSDPVFISNTLTAMSRALVPEFTTVVYLAPVYFEIAFSNS